MKKSKSLSSSRPPTTLHPKFLAYIGFSGAKIIVKFKSGLLPELCLCEITIRNNGI